MDDNSQQNTNVPGDVTQAKVPGERVIQPSAALIEEMKAQQEVSPTRPQGAQAIQQPSVQDPQTQSTNESIQPATAPSSIYPEVTRGIGANTPPNATGAHYPNEGESATSYTTSKSIIKAVKIVAGVLVAINLINVYVWLSGSHVGLIAWADISEILIGVALALGMYSLKDTARSFYVLLSSITLAFSCIGLVTFAVSSHTSTNTDQSNVPGLTRARLESSIQAVNNDKGLSAQDKQQEIQQLQKEISNLPSTTQTSAPSNTKQYIATGILIVTSAGPLIFFTRPSVKAVFS